MPNSFWIDDRPIREDVLRYGATKVSRERGRYEPKSRISCIHYPPPSGTIHTGSNRRHEKASTIRVGLGVRRHREIGRVLDEVVRYGAVSLFDVENWDADVHVSVLKRDEVKIGSGETAEGRYVLIAVIDLLSPG